MTISEKLLASHQCPLSSPNLPFLKPSLILIHNFNTQMMTKDIFCSLPAHQIKITGQKKPQNSFRKTLQYKKTIALRNSKCNIKFKIPQYQIQQNSSEYTAKPTKVSQYN